jgi:hypothetical protein
LYLHGAADCVDDAGKLGQHSVAGGLDDPTVVLLDLRIDELSQVRLQALMRPFLIRPMSRE